MRRSIVSLLVLVAFVFSLSASTVLAQDVCEGNFDCDDDVDGTDASTFKISFGRSQFSNPCPTCNNSPCPCTPPVCNQPVPVPKTGQTTTYATGDDGDLEKGAAWPNPRFTDNEDGTVTDNLTGLIWLGYPTCFGTRTWNNALSVTNGLEHGECGLNDGSNAGDWRVPNYRELFSLVDANNSYPALPSGHPFTYVITFGYWSSTTYAEDSSYAWGVYMSTGTVDNVYKDGALFVWPVRGPE